MKAPHRPPTLTVVQTTPVPTGVPTEPEPETSTDQSPRVLQVGSEGTTVHDTQDLLNELIGYADLPLQRIAEDGFYGPNTERAQRGFEQQVGLAQDGIATVDDRAQLEVLVATLESASADSTVALGARSAFVGTWQSRLNTWNALALETSPHIVVDDRFGADTEQATLAAEDALGLQVDGSVEPADRAALRAAIAELRTETYVRVLHQTNEADTPIIVKSFYANSRYCLRFVLGFAADERCTQSDDGDINIAYFVTVNGVSFIAGTANPNVSDVYLTTAGSATAVATHQIGNSVARAWVELVDSEPESIELRESNGSIVVDLRHSTEPTDRDFFGNTIAVRSPNFAQSYFIDDCAHSVPDRVALDGSLANSGLTVTVLNGTGTLVITAGTPASPITITGSVTSATVEEDAFTITGTFDDGIFDEAAFTATGSC